MSHHQILGWELFATILTRVHPFANKCLLLAPVTNLGIRLNVVLEIIKATKLLLAIATHKLKGTIDTGEQLSVPFKVYAVLKCFHANFTSTPQVIFMTMAHLHVFVQVAFLHKSLSAQNALERAISAIL